MRKKNAGKAPSIQFYFKDFVADMREHEMEIVGAWMLILCQIWHENTNGKITKNINQLARIMQTTVPQAQNIIEYIETENIANVTKHNGDITIINRRYERECKLRKNNRLRQEKHRNKNDDDDNNANITLPSSSSSSSSLKNIYKKENLDESKEEKPITVKIDFNFEKRKFTEITEADTNSWKEAYPAVDIVGEIRRAREWLLSHPEKRKKNYRRFLTGWFSRSQEKGGSRGYQNNHDPPGTDADAAAKREIEQTRKLIESSRKFKKA